jgi:hypothetical protein
MAAAPPPGPTTPGPILFFGSRAALSPFYISSSAIATQSNTGTVPIPNNPLDTKLFYLGSGVSNSDGAGGWFGSETSSFPSSNHDRLFWMYGNLSTFQTDYSNLYYITFQTRSLTTNTFTSGAIYPLNLKAPPPIIAPSYGYFLHVETLSPISFQTDGPSFFLKDFEQGIAFDSPTNDSLRSGSTIAGGILNQWTASSGTYNFVRGNFPSNTITPVRVLPIEITCSFLNITNPSAFPSDGWRVSLMSGSTVIASASVAPGLILPVNKEVNFRLDIYSGSSINANPLLAKSSTLGNTASIGPNSDNTKIKFRIEPAPDSDSEEYNPSTYTIGSIAISINQPMSGRQIAFEIPLINIFNPTNTPTVNDTGSYYVITPNLRGVDNVMVGGLPQSNFIGAIYYFKTAYHLWRDAWQVQSADGGPICSQDVWISASSNPSWAASAEGDPINYYINNIFTRNLGYLYASRSSNQSADFIDYGTSSTDAAVRNRSYVGITAELLGGSELIKHLKGNAAGTISASFPGNKFGGMIVVKASNVSTNSELPAVRYFPGTGNPKSVIYYKPGFGDPNSAVASTYNNRGLPRTEVQDGQVVPFSNFGYSYDPGIYTPSKSNMDWPTNIPWPPANPYSYDPG